VPDVYRPAQRLTRGLLALALCLPAAVALAAPRSGAAAPATAAQSTRPNRPVIDANFPDPDVLRVASTYHAYATNDGGQNIQHETSTDLRHWTPQPDALPTLGAWTGSCTFAPGGPTDHCVWAPDVSSVPGGYVMYYTARDSLAARECIGLATSPSPAGPFHPSDQPLVCPDGQRGTTDLGGAIDPSTFVDDNGKRYLLWKADGNCCAKAATIYLQPLSADGRTLTGPATELIHNDLPFEGRVVEAPTLVEHDGAYYLFYSANDFGGGNYRTGWARSASLTGPYVKSRTELMTTDQFHGMVVGPGGQDVFTGPDGRPAIVFHGWDPTYTYRAMYESALQWTAAGPHIAAADTRYQAEDGDLTDARVVADDSASNLQKVGAMDNSDSSVTFHVRAPHAGPASLAIRYANGSRDAANNGVAATDRLTVNGVDLGTVRLPNTAWGNWQLAEVRAGLRTGENTVTLTKQTYYAELDALDLYYQKPAPAPLPQPAGTPSRYEAENGTISDARAVSDPTASAGAKVGYLDHPDSSVTLTVHADRSGPAVLGIRYDNGSLDNSGYAVASTDTLTVNDAPAGIVTFRNTTWGNWQMHFVRTKLHAGVNTITLTKRTFYTELDAVDVY
jgi:hypothetical protein